MIHWALVTRGECCSWPQQASSDHPRGQATVKPGLCETALTMRRRCCAGMISPTSGEAVINGMSIRNQMGRIRQSLGVCPQFDILWPNITVAEHLRLYAAIKGYRGGDETEQAVNAAAHNVGERSPDEFRCTTTFDNLQALLAAFCGLLTFDIATALYDVEQYASSSCGF